MKTTLDIPDPIAARLADSCETPISYLVETTHIIHQIPDTVEHEGS